MDPKCCTETQRKCFKGIMQKGADKDRLVEMGMSAGDRAEQESWQEQGNDWRWLNDVKILGWYIAAVRWLMISRCFSHGNAGWKEVATPMQQRQPRETHTQGERRRQEGGGKRQGDARKTYESWYSPSKARLVPFCQHNNVHHYMGHIAHEKQTGKHLQSG